MVTDTLSFSFVPTFKYNGALNTSCSSTNGSKDGIRRSKHCRVVLLHSSTSDNNSDNVDDNKSSDIPCLPSVGQSSFSGETSSKKSGTIRLDGTSHAVGNVGSDKFELQYTCKVCETRNSHKVSRLGEN